jgi:hypothetical protein
VARPSLPSGPKPPLKFKPEALGQDADPPGWKKNDSPKGVSSADSPRSKKDSPGRKSPQPPASPNNPRSPGSLSPRRQTEPNSRHADSPKVVGKPDPPNPPRRSQDGAPPALEPVSPKVPPRPQRFKSEYASGDLSPKRHSPGSSPPSGSFIGTVNVAGRTRPEVPPRTESTKNLLSRSPRAHRAESSPQVNIVKKKKFVNICRFFFFLRR